MLTVTECKDRAAWDAAGETLGAHPLQTWGWGELKAKHHWTARRLLVTDGEEIVGGCQVLARRLPPPFGAMLYAPRGPMWVDGRGEEVVAAVTDYVRAEGRGVVFTMEPFAYEMPLAERFTPTPDSVLLAHTLIIDLTQTEDELMAAMSSNTRKSVRKVLREDVLEFGRATTDDELAEVLAAYKETAARAGFGLHEDQYYYDVHHELGDRSLVFVARKEGKIVAFLWCIASKATAIQLYSGATADGLKARANYGLKYHALTTAKELGCTRYDMFGLLNDGVGQFKSSFAKGQVDDLAGSFDLPLSPLYPVWTKAVPSGKKAVRALAGLKGKALGLLGRGPATSERPAEDTKAEDTKTDQPEAAEKA